MRQSELLYSEHAVIYKLSILEYRKEVSYSSQA